MELYKIVGGMPKKYSGGFVVLDNRIYTNPSDETIAKAGYKPMIVDEEPMYDAETQYLEKIYEDTEDAILVHWEIREQELVEDDAIIEEDIVEEPLEENT